MYLKGPVSTVNSFTWYSESQNIIGVICWAVILLDWSGVDLGVKSTPHTKKAVELQDSSKIQCKLPY